MNWLGPKSGGVGTLEAPASMRRVEQRAAKPSRSWLPSRLLRREVSTVVETIASTGPAFAEVATEAIASFRSQAIGTRCGTGRDAAARVKVVCSSAGHITVPSQLEVWVLLGDVDEDRIPPRWDPTQVLADLSLTSWALQLRAAALGHLMSLDWPDIDQVVVRIDSADRVERRGGWDYVVAHAA